MNLEPATLLRACLWAYLIGTVAGLVFSRRDSLASVCSFGAATLAGATGTVAALLYLSSGPSVAPVDMKLMPPLIPYISFTARLDSLGALFLLIVSLLSLALSAFSIGYSRGFFGK